MFREWHKQRDRNSREQLNGTEEIIKLKSGLEPDAARSRQKF